MPERHAEITKLHKGKKGTMAEKGSFSVSGIHNPEYVHYVEPQLLDEAGAELTPKFICHITELGYNRFRWHIYLEELDTNDNKKYKLKIFSDNRPKKPNAQEEDSRDLKFPLPE